MYIGFYNNTKQFNSNKMLTDPSSPIGDNLMYPFFLLNQRLLKMGHKTNTIDLDLLEKFDAVIFVDFPGLKNKYLRKIKFPFVLVSESRGINPFDAESHRLSFRG